jgi:hypothetical protein
LSVARAAVSPFAPRTDVLSRSEMQLSFGATACYDRNTHSEPRRPTGRWRDRGRGGIRLDPDPNFGLSGPSVGGAVGHTILRDHTAMDAPCAITRSRWDLRLSEFSADGTGWQSVAVFHRPSISPRSRFSAWGAGWPARPRRTRLFAGNWVVARRSTGQISRLSTVIRRF